MSRFHKFQAMPDKFRKELRKLYVAYISKLEDLEKQMYNI